MSGSLDGPWKKLGRAKYHIEVMTAQMAPYVEAQLNKTVIEQNVDGTEFVFHFSEVIEPNPGWPLILGDCLYNLRASLDYLVLELHRHHLGVPLNPQIEKSSMFPIFDRPEEYKAKGAWRVKHLPAPTKATIEAMQPYNATNLDRTPWYLELINVFTNIDKHREPNFTWQAAIHVPGTELPPEYGAVVEQFGGPLKAKAPVAKWTFAKSPHMDMDINGTVRVSISDGSREWDLLAFLTGAVVAIEDVFGRFPELPSKY